MMEELVVLVDENDQEIGVMEKMHAHEKGMLHRAFSVFLFNEKGEVLLQQRASSKYHSPDLWSNTCCSHPRPGEDVESAANRRLMEEMGMTASLTKMFSFQYKTHFSNNLIEHEIDHVFCGLVENLPHLNRDEVQSWKYIGVDEVKKDMKLNPENYTSWFKICFDRLIMEMDQMKENEYAKLIVA